MILEELWKEINPDERKLKRLIKAYTAGTVPELPYFIIGQEEAKAKVEEKLSSIDHQTFDRLMLTSNYGNGKTNLLKYLQLYFSKNSNIEGKNIRLVYAAANRDNPNIFNMLLALIDKRLINELISSINNVEYNEGLINDLCEDYEDIQDYIRLVLTTDTADLKELLQMGTGSLYYKSFFNKHSIHYISDYERKEVLSFFLTLFYNNNFLIIFALDELEKIYEKSISRLRDFLTSYRELIDVSTKIEGHLLLTAFTESHYKKAESFFEENPAFYSRIVKDTVEVTPLVDDENIKELIQSVYNLLTKSGEVQIDKSVEEIFSYIKNHKNAGYIAENNRSLMQEIIYFTKTSKDFVTLNDAIDKEGIREIFKTKYKELDFDNLLKNVSSTIFAPLEYYMTALNYNPNSVNKQAKRIILDDKDIYFIFDDTKLSDAQKENFNLTLDEDKKLIAFVPENVDFNIESIIDGEDDNGKENNIDLVSYQPIELYVLLELYGDVEYDIYEEKVYNILSNFFQGIL